MVVGLGCAQAPATGGEIVGVVDPSVTGVEKVMLMSALVAAVDVPDAGLVVTTVSGVAFTVVCVVPPPPASFEPLPLEDLPMPYAIAAAAMTSTTAPAIKSHVRPRRGAFPWASRTCIQ